MDLGDRGCSERLGIEGTEDLVHRSAELLLDHLDDTLVGHTWDLVSALLALGDQFGRKHAFAG